MWVRNIRMTPSSQSPPWVRQLATAVVHAARGCRPRRRRPGCTRSGARPGRGSGLPPGRSAEDVRAAVRRTAASGSSGTPMGPVSAVRKRCRIRSAHRRLWRGCRRRRRGRRGTRDVVRRLAAAGPRVAPAELRAAAAPSPSCRSSGAVARRQDPVHPSSALVAEVAQPPEPAHGEGQGGGGRSSSAAVSARWRAARMLSRSVSRRGIHGSCVGGAERGLGLLDEGAGPRRGARRSAAARSAGVSAARSAAYSWMVSSRR